MPATNPSDHVRAFAAICLPDVLKQRIGEFVASLQQGLGRNLIRWTQPEQVHLTLKFFGNVAGEQVPSLVAALEQSVAGLAQFELRLGELGAFPSLGRPRVIWLGLLGNRTAAEELQTRVDRSTRDFGNHSEARPFHPHLTLGRVREFGSASRQVGERLRSTSCPLTGAWQVEGISLMQSRLSPKGSSYLELALIPLKKTEAAPG
jgi:2'-5' RNA ligase